MSAPDRIIAWRERPGDRHGKWEDGPVHWMPGTGSRWYAAITPAVIAALPEVQALVADALERAAGEGFAQAMGADALERALTTLSLLPVIIPREVYAAIRALIPADHAAALAARDAKMRAEGRQEERERAIEICRAQIEYRTEQMLDATYPREQCQRWAAGKVQAELIRNAIRVDMGGEA